MAIVRLPGDAGLWVHSPVDLDEPLRAALEELGPVRHIVAPNYEHVKWAQQWRDAYPEATLWGTPGMMEKLPEISFHRELSRQEKAPHAWGGVLEVALFDCESVPIIDAPFFSEMVFHHVPTRTLICTDTFWSWPSEGVPAGTRAWKWAMDVIYLPLYLRVLVRDAGALERVLARIGNWKAVALLPCHGRYQAQGATESFLEHLRRD